MSNQTKSRLAAWSLVFVVCSAAFIAWGSGMEWRLGSLSVYQLFPLLGLLAFSIMWTQYAVGGLIRRKMLTSSALNEYFQWTGYAVLVLICLHPGLLVYQRFKDGFGLPPQSYETYVAPGLAWLTLLGTASLLIFLAFSFRRRFEKYSWWRFVSVANDAAMLAIAYHGLRLGSSLQQPWFRIVWIFYAFSLVVLLAYKYARHVGQPDEVTKVVE